MTELLRSTAQHLDPPRYAQRGYGFREEARSTLRAVKEDEGDVLELLEEHKTRESAAGTEIEKARLWGEPRRNDRPPEVERMLNLAGDWLRS